MINVLLVTNEASLERMICVTLTINGLSVTVANQMSDIMENLKNGSFSFLLLDQDYHDCAFVIRDRGYNLPIVIFDDGMNDLALGISYLPKPFEFTTLKATMNELFVSKNHLMETLIESGDFKIDIQKGLVMFKNKAVELGKLELAILVSLARKAGKIVTKEKMQRDLEAQGIFFNRSIFHHMKELKRKIHEISEEKLLIRGITGIGYQFLVKP